MLIEFTVGNFLSFKERVTLSMIAANTKARDPKVNENNTIVVNDKLTLLTSAAIYGANASGKSNLVLALTFMWQFVLSSSKESHVGERIDVSPFRLNATSEKEPSLFEIVFLLDNIQYRYGFETTSEKVVAEWLFAVPTVKEAVLFIRNEHEIKVTSKFKEGKGLEQRTRANALFLSVVAQFNGQVAQEILSWFSRVGFVSGLDDTTYRNFTISQFASENTMRNEIISLIRKLDVGIIDIVAEDGSTKIKTVHQRWDEQGQPSETIAFDIRDESSGTQKLFFLSGPLVYTLKDMCVLVIDEMEARLHPLMTRAILKLFCSLETNPNRAQLIFTTHDTNLLSNKLFRRDQIWFTEKDQQSSSHLYSLAEIKVKEKVRNDASFESDYLEGRYGAIPYLGDIQQITLDKK